LYNCHITTLISKHTGLTLNRYTGHTTSCSLGPVSITIVPILNVSLWRGYSNRKSLHILHSIQSSDLFHWTSLSSQWTCHVLGVKPIIRRNYLEKNLLFHK